MIVAHNVSAINTYNQMNKSIGVSNKSMEKLSSGYRINRAADDAAGLSISEKMRSQIRGLTQASNNATQGISMIQTAEGALNETHSILQRMRELAVQSANDTNAESDREALQNEINQLISEVNRIGNTTEFNGMKLLDGSKVKSGFNEKNQITNGGSLTFKLGSKGVINTAKLELTDDGIHFDNSKNNGEIDFSNLVKEEGKNLITISNKDGKLVAEAKFANASNSNAIISKVNELIQNDDGSWSYNNHGITFTVTKESADKYLVNNTNTYTQIDLYKANNNQTGNLNINNKTFTINSDYEDDSSSYGSITNFELVDLEHGNERLDYDRVEIEYIGSNAFVPEVEESFGYISIKWNSTRAREEGMLFNGTYLSPESFSFNSSSIGFELNDYFGTNEYFFEGFLSMGGSDEHVGVYITEKTGPSGDDNFFTITYPDGTSPKSKNIFRHSVKHVDEIPQGTATLKVNYYSDGNLIGSELHESGGLGDITSENEETINFDCGGLSFDLNLNDGFKTNDKVHLIVDLDKKLGTKDDTRTYLKDDESDNSVYFHVGANSDQVINTTFNDMRAKALGLTGNDEDAYSDEYTVNSGTDSTLTEKGLNISTRKGSELAIGIIDNAIQLVSEERSKYGAIQNRLEYTINNINATSENMQNAESIIRDTDMAEEMMSEVKSSILQQASQAMLTQAMQRPQQVLELLKQ